MDDVNSSSGTESSTRFSCNPMTDADQRKFCEMEGGCIRLLAPAGCGKTNSMLWRCLYLAERSPLEKPKFLIFTFTRAASEEIRDRLKHNKIFAPLLSQITVTTLNSWGYRYIKSRVHNPQLITDKKARYFCLINSLRPFWEKNKRICTVLSDKRKKNPACETIMVLNDTLKALGFRHDLMKSPEDIKTHLLYLDQCGMTNQVTAFQKSLMKLEIIKNQNDPHELKLHYFDFWAKTTDSMRRCAMLTLEDQKYWSLIELEQQLKMGQYTSGGGRYHHIMVDEFQDINPLDLNFLKTIAEINKAQLTIIGDDDQAIYEWRGASPSFILEPQAYFNANYTTCILGTNYRSPKNIVELSQKLISHNKRRVSKPVVSASQNNAFIQVNRFSGISKSISFTLDLVKRLLKDKSIQNIALIGRKRAQIIPYQIIFAGQNIPFYAAEDLQVFLSEAFNQLQEILAIHARCKTSSADGSDPIKDILTLLNHIRHYPLSKDDRESLISYFHKTNRNSFSNVFAALYDYQGKFKGEKGNERKIKYLHAILALLLTKTVSESIQAISENFEGLQKDYGKSLEDIFYTDPPFLYLVDYAKCYNDDYDSFQKDIDKAINTLANIPDEGGESENDDWKQRLHLMTALRAKGKEFDAVIILDANEGIWPSQLAKTENELEQERRLFYVAMTRARKQLYFLVNDQILDKPVIPSSYLSEMDMELPITNDD
jgi:DNA helicase-2/ATP-dependent DNA helicase PcrA